LNFGLDTYYHDRVFFVVFVQSCSACHLLSRWFLAQLIFSTLKIEATCSSETSVDFQRSTRRYIPEDRSHLIRLVRGPLVYDAP
jgi:hypothetical protein